eukprot:6006306-Ditylum_brightwellii.AAC.1
MLGLCIRPCHCCNLEANKVACRIAETYSISTINNLNTLYYTVAITLCKTIPKGEKHNGEKTDSKEATLLKKVDKARTQLSWHVALKRANPLSPTKHHLLKGRQYGEVLCEAHMILAPASTKLRKYLAAKKQKVNNGLFHRSHKDFYSSLRSQTKVVSNPPSQQELDKLWRQLLGTQSQHNEDAEWLHQEKKFVEKTKEQEWTPVAVDKLDGVIRCIKNWKAP